MIESFSYLSRALDVLGANPIQYVHFDIKQYELIKNTLLGSIIIDDSSLKFECNGYIFILKFEYIKII